MSHAWLIGYDITHPRRLARVHRIMVNFAMPIEYSMFLLLGSASDLDECLSVLGKVIDRRVDDVRCYCLPLRGHQERVGRATLPAGIQWTGLPAGRGW